MTDVPAHDQTVTHRYLVQSAIQRASTILHIAGQAQPQTAVSLIRMAGRHCQSRVIGPKGSTVLSIVGRHASNELQVLKAIVGLVTVFVMDQTVRWDRTVCLFPYPSVFKDSTTTRQGQTDISSDCYGAVTAGRYLKVILVSVET